MNLYYRIKNTISYFWYNLRARYQRFKRGWAYGDVWNMFDWFMTTVKPMLIHLRDHGIGIPLDLYLDGEDNERKAWEDILTEMIECLDNMNEEQIYDKYDLWGEHKTKNNYEYVNDLMNTNKDRFFELFSKYYFDLWD